jgi:hypothetical protein
MGGPIGVSVNTSVDVGADAVDVDAGVGEGLQLASNAPPVVTTAALRNFRREMVFGCGFLAKVIHQSDITLQGFSTRQIISERDGLA